MKLPNELIALLQKRAPNLLAQLEGVGDPRQRVHKLDELEAAGLLREPLTVHPYPHVACEERDRLAAMGQKTRLQTIEKKEYNSTKLYIGRKEFGAWYRLVRTDLEVYAQTIGGVGPKGALGQRLCRALEGLASAYVLMPAPWPHDRVKGDTPCTTPALYQHLARKWITPLRVVARSDDFDSRPESLL